MRRLINDEKRAKIDYIAIVDQKRLREIKKVKPGSLIALAVKIGKTRLIDNTIIR